MSRQKRWNLVTLAALILMVLGFILFKSEAPGIGKLLIWMGILVLAAGIVGSSWAYKKHPYHCPVCGAVVRPVGRWLPGGLNGTDTVPCAYCGAVISLRDLKQD